MGSNILGTSSMESWGTGRDVHTAICGAPASRHPWVSLLRYEKMFKNGRNEPLEVNAVSSPGGRPQTGIGLPYQPRLHEHKVAVPLPTIGSGLHSSIMTMVVLFIKKGS